MTDIFQVDPSREAFFITLTLWRRMTLIPVKGHLKLMNAVWHSCPLSGSKAHGSDGSQEFLTRIALNWRYCGRGPYFRWISGNLDPHQSWATKTLNCLLFATRRRLIGENAMTLISLLINPFTLCGGFCFSPSLKKVFNMFEWKFVFMAHFLYLRSWF